MAIDTHRSVFSFCLSFLNPLPNAPGYLQRTQTHAKCNSGNSLVAVLLCRRWFDGFICARKRPTSSKTRCKTRIATLQPNPMPWGKQRISIINPCWDQWIPSDYSTLFWGQCNFTCFCVCIHRAGCIVGRVRFALCMPVAFCPGNGTGNAHTY